MKKNEKRAQRVGDIFDMPLGVISDAPRIELLGKNEIWVENIRGILDYNENCIKINTTVGILKIEGDEFFINSISDDSVNIKGTIIRMEFV